MKSSIQVFFVIIALICFSSTSAFAQISSNGTGGGDWNTPATWSGNTVPIASDNVVILPNDSVFLTAAGTCTNLALQANSKLALNAASLSIPGSAWNFDTTSTVYYNGTTTVATGPVYGNLVYMSATGGPAANSTLTITGNLTVTTNTLRGISATSGTNTINVVGNVYLSGTGSRISAVNSSAATTASCTWYIGGNVSLTGNNSGNRIVLFESAGPHTGSAVYNINGNLSIGTSCQINLRSSTSATASSAGTINIKGNVSNSGDIRSNTGSAGILTINLIGTTAQQWTGAFPIAFPANQSCDLQTNNSAGVTLNNNAAINTNDTINVLSGGLLNLGTYIVSGSGPFNLFSGASLVCGNSSGLNGNLTTSGAITLSTAANYTFNGSSAQVTGALLPAAVNNLTINNGNGVSLSSGTTVDSTLTLSNGALSIGANTLTLNGDVSYAGGSLTGGAASNINITGPGSFALPSITLNNLTIDRANGLSLTGNVNVGGILSLTTGVVSTSANTLAIGSGGSVSRTAGYIIGRLQKYVNTGSSVPLSLELGTANGYSPVNITFANVSSAGNFSGAIVAGEYPDLNGSGIDITKSANEYWSFATDASIDTYVGILKFNGADLDVATNPFNFIASVNNGSTWSPLTVGSRAVDSIQISGPLSAGGIIALGEPQTFNITASAGANGSISPSGTVVVAYGGTLIYTITPDAHYQVDSLFVDDIKVDSTTSYTFTNVVVDHTIRAVFAVERFAIVASAGYGGTISPGGIVSVPYGTDTTFTINTAGGHRLDSVLVDGSNQGAISSYQFTNVTAAHTISAYFTTVFTLTLTQTGVGTVTPVPSQATYDTNSVVQLTAIPGGSGFFVGWSGSASGTTNPLNVTMNSNKTIKALFGTTIVSNGTGGGSWNTGTTWIGNIPPTGVDSVIIAGTDAVEVTKVALDSCGALVIQSGGKLQADTTLFIYGNTLVNGTLVDTLNSSSTSILNTTGTITFGNGGVYRHGINAGVILTASTVWGTGSTCMITGSAGANPSAPPKGTKYYNYIWSCASQSTNLNCGWDSVTVNGDLTCAASGTGQWRMTNAANIRYIFIKGNVIVTGGYLTASGSSGAALYNVTVDGDIRLQGGTFNLCGGSGGYGLWKLNGNLSLSNGAIFTVPSNKSGYTRLMFTKKNGTQTYSKVNAVNNNMNYGVDSNATVILDTALVVGNGTNIGALVMTYGKFVTTSTNFITLVAGSYIYGQLDAVPTGSSYNYVTSNIKPIGSTTPGYVDGPLRFTIAATTQKVDSLPLGSGSIYRPTVLSITQDAATSTIYSAELINSAPTARTLPGTLDSVSQARYIHVVKGTGANVSSATIQLSYDTNDLTDVSDKDQIRTAKDDGAGNWVNLGGSGTDNNTGVVLSNAFGTSTGLGTLTTNDFVVAHVNPLSIPVAPTLTTDTVTYISTTFASSGGVISLDGNAAITAKGVCWNTTGTPTIANDTTNNGTTSAPFTSRLTNLTAGGTYYVRAYATNSAGTGYGNERSFTTLTALAGPTVITDSVGNIVNTNAKGYGNVTQWGGSDITDRGICWSTGHNPTLLNDFNSGGSDIGKFNAPIGGLTLGTTYYARAYAVNSVDTSYGSEVSFVTPAPQPDVYKVVDLNGTIGVNCDYTDIQSAFDGVQSNYTGRWIIYVKKGIYYDKMTLAASKINVILIGESRDSTILTYDDYAGLNRTTHGVTSDGTNTSYSVAIDAADFQAQNLTIQNTATYSSQAVALRTNGDRQAYYDCNILGRQDTYYTWGGSSTGPDRIYNKNCLITGSVDFIFGRDVAVFDSCKIYCNREGGTLTAAATEPGYSFGYVFLNDTIASLDAGVVGFDGRPMVSFYLGRPWQSSPKTVYLNCYEPATLNAAGWTTMGPNPALYSEYNCFGPGYVSSRPEIWSGTHQPSAITGGQAATYTIANIFSKATSRGSSTTSWWYAANWMPVKYTGPVTSVEDRRDDSQIINSYALHQNYPNPFNPTTTISYDILKTGKVSLKVYDTYGREVATLVNGIVTAGRHQEVFDAKNLASGVYFARLQTEVMSSTIKLVMIK